jgi:RNA polymerase sigma-70 factor (ECF subfamily)
MNGTVTDTSSEIIRPYSAEMVQMLVDNHRDFLRFLERRVESRAVAEDILQDAFIKGLNRLDSIRDEESVVAWFYRMLRNSVTDHYRRQGAKDRALTSLAKELDEAVEPAELRETVCRCVARLADTLKPEYASALKRIEVDGLSMQAYAEEAGITANNAAVRVYRARQALKKQVSVSCGTCASHGCFNCTCDESQGGCAPKS